MSKKSISEVSKKGQAAKSIEAGLGLLSTEVKDRALEKMAQLLRENIHAILRANAQDLKNAKKNKMSTAFLDRLALNPQRIEAMAKGLEAIAQLKDPIGELLETINRPNGLKILKKRVPIGVIGIIFEARPNVTADAAGLCFKTGNAVILRGGSDAIESNKAIVKVIRLALSKMNLPADAVQLIENTDRKLVTDFLTANDYLDLIIPRGSNSLIQRTVKEATVPTIETGEGNCHIYVHEKADLNKTLEIIYNAKVQRPSVCNAVESLVIDQSVAAKFVPAIVEKLSPRVQMVGDTLARKYSKKIGTATEEDWGKEYSDFKLSIKTVKNADEAIAHISKYHTQHSDCIMTEDKAAADKFMQSIDSCSVLHNASTRFVDGGEFGFGAEIGISTQKIHARGPMGLKELTSYKYFVYGDGQVRS